MEFTKIEISNKKINLRKKPYEPIVLAKIDGSPVEISIADNKVEILSGEVPSEIIDNLKLVVAQYFLPVRARRTKDNNPTNDT